MAKVVIFEGILMRKLKTIFLTTCMMTGIVSLAHAADQGHGSVTFRGAIIEAPCSIDPDSIDQKVELGEVANVVLNNGGMSLPKHFQIKLKNCSTTTLSSVTTTFTGAEGKDGKLAITGSASGAGIVLLNGDNSRIKLGTPTKAQTIQNGSNTLNFTAYLQGDGQSGDDKSNAIVPGEFNSITDFTLAYQ